MIKIIRRNGYSPVYFWIGDGDSMSPEKCLSLGIPFIRWDSIPWSTIPSYLKQFKLVVSGRHHMIISALMAGIPFIPLGSNTWKIEGLCELFLWPIPVISSIFGFKNALSTLTELDSEMKKSFEFTARAGLEYAKRNVPESSDRKKQSYF